MASNDMAAKKRLPNRAPSRPKMARLSHTPNRSVQKWRTQNHASRTRKADLRYLWLGSSLTNLHLPESVLSTWLTFGAPNGAKRPGEPSRAPSHASTSGWCPARRDRRGGGGASVKTGKAEERYRHGPFFFPPYKLRGPIGSPFFFGWFSFKGTPGTLPPRKRNRKRARNPLVATGLKASRASHLLLGLSTASPPKGPESSPRFQDPSSRKKRSSHSE